jgi:carboxyl-terminal processing protease
LKLFRRIPFHKTILLIARYIVALLLLCAIVFVSPALQFKASRGVLRKEATRRENQLAIFDDVWQTINERYYDRNFHGVDWQAQRAAFRDLAGAAQGSNDLYKVLRQMIGALGDAHTRIYSPGEKFDWRHPRTISVGASLREVAGEAIVTAVERKSEAERAGLRAGDKILRVDDEPALEVFARRLREAVNSSTNRAARLRAMAGLFDGAAGTSVKVAWLDGAGKEREARLRREWREPSQELRVRRVRAGFPVVAFDAFTESIAVDFARQMAGRLSKARGLVIDLRNNGGGEAEAMTEIASAFLPAGASLGRFTDRANHIVFEPRTRAALLLVADKVVPFRAPLVVLTSERTSSAAEIFTAALKAARRAVVIGTPTCGCVLAISRRHSLPDGGELDISEMDYRTTSGARLEGAGVIPDEQLPLDRQDLRARRDRALARAIEVLEAARHQ